jgi:hypothetical protein
MMKELIKPIIILASVIIISAVIVRVLTSGDTLAEYAEKNPDIAFASPAPDAKAEAKIDTEDEPEKAVNDELEVQDSDEIESDGETPSFNDEFSDTAISDAIYDEANISAIFLLSDPENMTEYQPGFYKEPLNDDIFAYISGISYPNAAGDSLDLPNIVENIDDIVISREELCLLTVLHYDFEGNVKTGHLICNVAIADDLLAIFYELYSGEYQIEKIRLIEEYGGDDDLSMADNNTSCFNYRKTLSGNMSRHAYGLAVDINPFYNPYVIFNRNGTTTILPEGSDPYTDRSRDFPYKIDENDLCYRLFKEYGFTWGGDWNNQKDWQHFQRAVN